MSEDHLPELSESEMKQVEADANEYNTVTYACSKIDYRNILIRERRRAKKREAGWVSVKERRPEIATKILICSQSTRHPYLSGVFSGFRANGGWFLYYDNGKTYVYNDDEHITITAWMPLPEPPKEP